MKTISHAAFVLTLCLSLGTGLAFAHDASSLTLRASQGLPSGIREIRIQNRVGTLSVRGIPGSDIRVQALLKPGNGREIDILGLFTWGGTSNFSRQTADGSIRFEREESHHLRVELALPHDPRLKDLTIDWQLEIPQSEAIRITNHIGRISISHMKTRVRARNNIGTISIRHSEGPVFARTNIGKIVIDGVTRSLRVRTNIGHVQVRGAITSIGLVDLETNVGSLHIRGLTQLPKHSSGPGGQFLYHGTGRHHIRIEVNVGTIRLDLTPPSPKPSHP